jgi:predicted RNA-binding Zn-ribbon protein involved in translation (DUF1610 family)
METFVELLCPECSKHWEATPSALPDPDESFDCPNCGERRRPSEFTRTARDLEVLREELS